MKKTITKTEGFTHICEDLFQQDIGEEKTLTQICEEIFNDIGWTVETVKTEGMTSTFIDPWVNLKPSIGVEKEYTPVTEETMDKIMLAMFGEQ